MKRKVKVFLFAIPVVLIATWCVANPPGRFGYCTFGLTTYGCIPYPASDIQVSSDGETRTIDKTHALKLQHIQWLLDSKPSTLIISIGWDGVVHPAQEIKDLQDVKVLILKTNEAVKQYNRLKRAGESVAIHVHSTC